MPVGEPEPAEVDRPRPGRPDDDGVEQHGAPVAAVCARVHADAPARRPGDRGGELEPAEPRVPRAVEADRVLRAAAGDQRLALDPHRRELALEPEDERVDPFVGGEQIRAEPDRLDRHALRRGPPRRASSSWSSVAGRPSQRAGPPVPMVVSRASGTPSSSSIIRGAREGAAGARVHVAGAEHEQHVARLARAAR